jgi:hypothetical protein
MTAMPNTPSTNLRIEIAEETLTRLITDGQVCAADLRCLDCESKQCLWRLCLKSCTNHRAPDRRGRPASRHRGAEKR